MQKTLTKSLILTAILTIALGASYLFAAWTGPNQAPPGGNTETPIHIGSTNQVKDGGLSLDGLSVFGGGYFQGNVGIGTVSPQATLDVAGGIKADGKIKVGNDAVSPTAGATRFTGTDFEGYDGTEWKSLTSGGGASLSPSYTDCINAGGNWVETQGACYFPGSSCPSSWTKKEAYTSTQAKYCGSCSGSCTTPSHYRANSGVESCSYQRGVLTRGGGCQFGELSTCIASQTEIGCVKN